MKRFHEPSRAVVAECLCLGKDGVRAAQVNPFLQGRPAGDVVVGEDLVRDAGSRVMGGRPHRAVKFVVPV